MDGTPLDQAYSAAKNADAAAMAGDYGRAAELFTEAADKFDEVATSSPSNPALSVLRALATQHRNRAEYLRSGRARADMRRTYVSSNPQQSVQAQLAAARGQPQISPPSQQQHKEVSPGASMIAAPAGDAINVLATKSQAVFTRTLEQALGRTISANGGTGKIVTAPPSIEPSESFYLVKPKAGAQAPPPTTYSAQAVTAAMDSAVRAQRQFLKSGLQQLRHEVALKEQKLQDEHTEEVDRLRAENDKLRVQVSKMKSRWDDLKQSARKRREEV